MQLSRVTVRASKLLAAVAAAMIAPAVAAPAHARPEPRLTEVVVAGAHGRSAQAERLVRRLGGHVDRRLRIIDGFTARIPQRALPRLERSRAVRSLSRNSRLHVSSTTDPGADLATATTAFLRIATGAAVLDRDRLAGAGVDVAVVDSGVVPVGNLAEPGALVKGPDFSNERRTAALDGMDTFGHGTHVAGVIAGSDPLTGYEGVAPAARIISIKVAGADGATSLAQVLGAYEWIYRYRRAAGFNIRVLNISLGVDNTGGYGRDPLAWASEQMWKAGVAVVAAAGNNGADSGTLDLPAADPYVIAVGATDGQGTDDPADDTVADYSSRDANRPPDVVAPGTRIVSLRDPGSTLDTEFPAARIGDGYFRGSGTSQAAAVVSGLSARLFGQRPDLTPDQLKLILRRGAVDLGAPAAAQGAGRVDVARSSALAVPTADEARQTAPRAVLDLSKVFAPAPDTGPDDETESGNGTDDVVADDAEWAGRRWSGRRWSGMKWSGMKWSGRRWSSADWDGGS
jgi:serine protease AprX